MKHELKVQPQFWDAIADGSNPSNIRRDDRKFRVGDLCELKRYDPSHGFTGQSVERVITHILMPEDFPNGLPAGYVILGFGKSQYVPGQSTPSAAQVLDFLDTFAGQENTAEEVRDFVQQAAMFVAEGKSREEWLEQPGLDGLVEWCDNEAS